MKYLAYIFPVAVLVFLVIFAMDDKDSANASSAEQQTEQQTMSDNKKLDSDKSRLSYALGTQVAKGIKAQSATLDVDLTVLNQAITDTLTDKPLLMNDQEVNAELVKLQEAQVAASQKEAEENKAKGAEFLEANKKKEGVKVTDSGLQYQIVEPGSGEFPSVTSTVKVNYVGSLIDGTEFDNSVKRNQPAVFRLNQVVKGWTEGLQLVKPGGKIKLVIPAELGYGAQGRPSIPANSVLIFEVELLEIVD